MCSLSSSPVESYDKSQDMYTRLWSVLFWFDSKPSQRTHGVIITSLLCQNDVVTSLFCRNNDVIILSCIRWVLMHTASELPNYLPSNCMIAPIIWLPQCMWVDAEWYDETKRINMIRTVIKPHPNTAKQNGIHIVWNIFYQIRGRIRILQ